MLTVCPKCTLTLAVTAADLRIGQGYVRCGRCATVFNALLALSDASTLELPGASSPPVRNGHSATATVSVIDASRTGTSTPGASSDTAPAPVPFPAPAPTPAPAHSLAPASEPEPPQPESALAEPFGAAANIFVDPSLAAEPLDMLLEQTSTFAKPNFATEPLAEPSAAPTPDSDVPDSAVPDNDIEVEAVELGSGTDEVAVEPIVATAPAAEPRTARLEGTGTMRTIVMEGNSVSQSEEFVDIDTIDSEIAAATRRALEAEARKSIASLDQDLGASGTYARLNDSGTTAAPEPVETRLTETGSIYVHDRNSLYAQRVPPPKPPPSRLLWSTYAVLLVLALGAQATHYWRNDLAVRSDLIGHSVTRLYAILGLPLTPNWDLHGYDVRQLGAATNGSGDNAIRVRISLTNRAPRAQPWPVLRLSLYNRYGKRVAARDLMPRDYLPRDKALDLMPVAKQIDSEVAVMDPGPDASSFELDVCIPAPHGLRCAGDSPLRPAAHS
jgi:predicted Zn finger-like uncharacterized protein